jgi:hypothetical protein
MLPYKFLKGIQWRRNVSMATTVGGTFCTAGLIASLGSDIPATFATMMGLGFNTAFPGLKWMLLRSGVKSLYGYWTKFDMCVKERLETDGAGNITISAIDNDNRTKEVSFIIRNQKVGPITIGKRTIHDNVKSILARLSKMAEIQGEPVRTNLGNETRVSFRMRLYDDGKGMYESFKKAAWVDGDINFKHDLIVQGSEHSMDEKLKGPDKILPKLKEKALNVVRTERLKRAAASRRMERVLGVFEDIMEEKNRRSAVINGRTLKIKLSKDETKILKECIKNLDKVEDPRQIYRFLVVIARAQMLDADKPEEASKLSDAAVMLTKLLNPGKIGLETKAVGTRQLDSLIAKIPPQMINRTYITGLLREALSDKEKDIKDEKGNKNGVENNMDNVLANSFAADEVVFLGALQNMGLIEERARIIKKMYGIEAEDYPLLTENFSVYYQGNGMTAQVSQKVPKGKQALVLAKILKGGGLR